VGLGLRKVFFFAQDILGSMRPIVDVPLSVSLSLFFGQ